MDKNYSLSNSGGGVGALNKAQQVNVAPQTATQEMLDRINGIVDDLAMSNDRMVRVIDRAFGGQKAALNESGGPAAVPQGNIGAIMDRLERATALAKEQGALISRLDTIV